MFRCNKKLDRKLSEHPFVVPAGLNSP